MPRVRVPAETAGNKPRIFELRIYESHSETAALKKIEMFNEGGEIGIFDRVGLRSVFFGQTLIGRRQPNLVYMTVHQDMVAREKTWEDFRNSAGLEGAELEPGLREHGVGHDRDLPPAGGVLADLRGPRPALARRGARDVAMTPLVPECRMSTMRSFAVVLIPSCPGWRSCRPPAGSLRRARSSLAVVGVAHRVRGESSRHRRPASLA